MITVDHWCRYKCDALQILVKWWYFMSVFITHWIASIQVDSRCQKRYTRCRPYMVCLNPSLLWLWVTWFHFPVNSTLFATLDESKVRDDELFMHRYICSVMQWTSMTLHLFQRHSHDNKLRRFETWLLAWACGFKIYTCVRIVSPCNVDMEHALFFSFMHSKIQSNDWCMISFSV